MLRLRRAPDALPLAFQIQEALESEELGGNIREPLDTALAREGVGLKTVTVRGLFARESGARALSPWSQTMEVAGTLDSQGLPRLIHAMARQFIGGFGKGNSPPELFVTDIRIGDGPEHKAPPKKPKKPKTPKKPKARRAPTYRVRYRDRHTGRYVPQDTWKRSRAQLKGRPGRYVRVLTED